MLYKLMGMQDRAPDGTGYNDPPVNLKPMTEPDFAKSGFRSQDLHAIEFRQMFVDGKMVEARLFWFADGTGVAISSDYWEGKISYYSFGCNHHFESKTFEADRKQHCSVCNTDIYHDWMDLIAYDTGWSMDEGSSIPSRGVKDYNRTITFVRQLSAIELNKVVMFLKKVDCPGWTGVGSSSDGKGVYRFRTTHDSSD